GRRRRALAAAAERGAAQEAGPRPVFALPPAEADRTDQAAPEAPAGPVDDRFDDGGRHDGLTHDPDDDHTPPQPHPTSTPTGRRRARPTPDQPGTVPPGGIPGQGTPVPAPGRAAPVPATAAQAAAVGPEQSGVPGQGQSMPGQSPFPGQQMPGQAVPAAQVAQAISGQAVPAQGLPAQGLPAQALPGQPALGQQPVAQAAPGQPLPNQPLPGQPVPAQGVQGQQVPQQAPQQAAQAVAQQVPAQGTAPQPALAQGQAPGQAIPAQAAAPAGQPQPQPWPAAEDETPDAGTAVPPNTAAAPAPAPQAAAAPLPPERAVQPRPPGQALPAEAAAAPVDPNSTQGRAFSVRTLGQGVAFSRAAAQLQTPGQPQPATPPHGTNGSNGSGRRRKLGTRPEPAAGQPETTARQHPQSNQATPATPPAAQAAAAAPAPAQPSLAGQASVPGQPSLAGQVPAAQAPSPTQPSLAGQTQLAPGNPRLPGFTDGAGRSYAIGAPDENAAEGPEPLDGPGGAVEVSDQPQPRPMDDELPPEPLDNPRRLLVWPAPDVTTQQALSDRGYRPVIVHSREEVNAQIAAFPAALFVDPLTGPITRTALQSLRQAAVAAEVPVLVTAGLGQATREAAYGADPAVLLKALAPRDSEQHPPRVLLIEEHAEIALALTATLERRGMQVARAASDADAVTLASQLRPNLVVMDLLQVRRRRAGIVDWLRANGQLNRTPLVVYTAAVDQADLPRLASGETVLFLAERSTSTEVQSRIVDLLARIGTN
ncbi:hypothetical protein ACWCRB_21015, partial [Streptomyces sp. NPDC002156]